MVNLTTVVNLGDIEEQEYELIPEGDYTAQIVASEMKDTKAGTGQYLELRIQILEEPYQGRLVFDRLNLVNPNSVAVEIGQRALLQICKAVGVEDLEDSEQLHGREMKVKIKIKPAVGDWPAGNEVKKYLSA